MSDDGPGPLFTALRVEGPADLGRPAPSPEPSRTEAATEAEAAERPAEPTEASAAPPSLPAFDSLDDLNAALSEAAGEWADDSGFMPYEPYEPYEPSEVYESPERHDVDAGEPVETTSLQNAAAELVEALTAEPPPPPVSVDPSAPLEETLQALFGFPCFRPGQREIIESVLAGQDTLAVMPTGGGKSLTYLLPAYLSEKVTIIISPLISLMQDQVSKLEKQGLDAAALNSQLSYADQGAVLEDLKFGRLKVLFVAPERFRNARFRRTLEHVEVGLLAVDEAHCVSQWGHDFRPDYLCLDEWARLLGRPPILAVTATATERVREDIVEQLGMQEPKVLVRGFDRSNLFLSVNEVVGGREKKIRTLIACIKNAPQGGGIVYCATRKNTERVARRLRAAKLGKVGVYHAGLGALRREREQDKFFNGDTDIVVATNAFGLGIDKQDLRFVIHHDLPGSLEAYYQEAGRAGRDGKPAVCALLFAWQDKHLQDFFIRTSHPERALVLQVGWAMDKGKRDADGIANSLPGNASSRGVEAAMRLIEQAGGKAADVDFAEVAARRKHEEQLLERMIGYAKRGVCRRRTILNYFGAPEVARSCEACDVCSPKAGARTRATTTGTTRKSTSKKSTSKKSTSKKSTTRKKTTKAAEPMRELDAPGDAELLGLLRRMRTKLAKKKRWKPYQVFNDRTMLAIAAARPKTRAELLEIHGIAEKKASLFGDAILEAVAKIG